MRLGRVTIVSILSLLVLVMGFSTAAVAKPAAAKHNYTVLVGAENVQRGIDVMAYFPDSITIHVGDAVHWAQNANEIHTVTFLGGTQLPDFVVPAASIGATDTPSPLVFNPVATDKVVPAGGMTSPTTFANSGVMGRETGQYRSFDLTFAATGVYPYVCIVHGTMMSGTITVVGPKVHIPSPMQVGARANLQIARQMAKAPAVIREANRQIKPATQNQDGTWTHYISMGYSKGQIDLMQFFPGKVNVRPGDTVVWEMSASNDAPHTVTFLNGQPEPDLIIPVPQQSGPPVLYINPAVLFPAQPAADLTRTGLYSSGLMNPIPGSTFTEVIGSVTPGPLRYLCMLHDTSGMRGTLTVRPQ